MMAIVLLCFVWGLCRQVFLCCTGLLVPQSTIAALVSFMIGQVLTAPFLRGQTKLEGGQGGEGGGGGADGVQGLKIVFFFFRSLLYHLEKKITSGRQRTFFRCP